MGFDTTSQISSEKQSLGPPWAEAGMGCGLPLYQKALSQLSQHLLHKGARSGPGTWVHFAQPAKQQVAETQRVTAPQKPNALEVNSSLSGRAETRTAAHGSECRHPEAGIYRGMWALTWVRYFACCACGHPGAHSADSWNAFGWGGCPRTSPAVPKLQTPA